ncbi:volume-regulated anion channel subunit LRRC8D-like [Callorhinchus milii]|uniref:Leucine-rich repeat-containing protein 8D-like n=1 Tax=Callorhinchus milii TaxID=7868 RepID=A0A4W3IRQ8_CALMI|nr:volume-regulated anion channel subunit LRRC8D-like [Callorhinchus milii]|eukprot:gi/632969197/ref/XP_007900957.1/ PREDICTED: leucine-rich repeat-containing protein 8D-like [Callorhinchus milii]
MFTLGEITSVSSAPSSYRIFKPWWDTFMDYLAVVMLMIGIFGGTLQIYKNRSVCLPILNETMSQIINDTRVYDGVNSTVQGLGGNLVNDFHIRFKSASPLTRSQAIYAITENQTNLDFQQFFYINNLCYFSAVPWFSKYFCYFILIHTIGLMVASNFWFKFPKTSSKIEHLTFILEKCMESPWTTDALSLTASGNTEKMNPTVVIKQKEPSSATSTLKDVDERTSELLMLNESFIRGATRTNPVIQRHYQMLDKKDGEQAKALFEKVKKFRLHVEKEDSIYKLYVGQILFKTVVCSVVLIYFSLFINAVKLDILCRLKTYQLTGYEFFICTFSIAFILKKLLLLYLCTLAVYIAICIYTLVWIFRKQLKQYYFEKRGESQFSDVPNVKNDFAFLLHLIDQYDRLYCQHFSIFLSEASEKKLKALSLNTDWTMQKVQQHLTKTSKEQFELHLFMLSGFPESVYDATELQVLKVELCNDVNINPKVTQLIHLEELWIINCTVTIKAPALLYLSNQLKVLGVTFSNPDEIPDWIHSLTRLRELHLTGIINTESKALELEFLKELRYLKVLSINSNLSKIPFNVLYVAPHLFKLSIQNNNSSLAMFQNLGNMVNLAQLDLQNCALKKIPRGILHLYNLRELNLQYNELTVIEEISSFQHLRRLSCLKLCFNQINMIPKTINLLSNLEYLYISNNYILILPTNLFSIRKLRHLDLNNNQIIIIPTDIGKLLNLQFLDLSYNKISVLPDELYQCRKLKTLKLSKNSITVISGKIQQLTHLSRLELLENNLEELPVELGECSMLKKNGLLVDQYLFDSLPLEIRMAINSGTEVEVKLLLQPTISHSQLDHAVVA